MSAASDLRLVYRRSDSPPDPAPLDRAALAELYAYPGVSTWVRTNFVSTLDGAAAGPDHRSGSINTDSDGVVFDLLRALCDVVLVGAGTVRAEGYRAIELDEHQQTVRASVGLAPVPTLAILTGSLDVDPAVADGSGPHGEVLILTTTTTGHDRFSAAGIDVVVLPDAAAGTAVDALAGRGLARILCEGGASLNHQLLAAGLVDDVCLTFSPLILGGDMGRIVTGGLLGDGVAAQLQHCLIGGDDTVLTRWTTGSQGQRGSATSASSQVE